MSGELKHTPPPWVIRGQVIIGNEMNGYICTWSGRSANALLIAAAPDMISALFLARDVLSDMGAQVDVIDAVIEKATGAKP